MPEGDVRRNPSTGDVWRQEKVDGRLQWVELDDDAAVIAERVAEQGPVMAGAAAFASGVTLGAVGPEAEQAAEYRSQFPKASLAGDAAAILAPLPFAKQPGTMATNVLNKVAAKTPKASGNLIRRPSNILGRTTTTGSALRMGEAALEAIPGLNIPLLAQKAINARRINRSFAEALGLGDEAVEAAARSIDDVRPAVIEHFDEGYRAVYNAVDNVPKADLKAVVESASESGHISNTLGRVLEKKVALNGEDIHSLRSELSAAMRSQQVTPAVAKDIGEHIKAIDEVIEQALAATDDAATMADFKKLNTQFAVWAQLRKGRGIGADGMINPRAADGRFQGAFGDRYMAGELDMGDDAINQFLRNVREGSQLDVGMPSSGTAERAIIGSMALGGLGIAGQ